MQDAPLTLTMVLQRVERLTADKTLLSVRSGKLDGLSYAATIDRCRRLASALGALGIRPGDRVGTLAWNHREHLETQFAVPLLGGIVTPLNPRLPSEDLSYIVNHAGLSAVLVDTELLDVWLAVPSAQAVEPLIVSGDPNEAGPPGALAYEEVVHSGEPELSWPCANEDQALALCYTSGTTGPPKGVLYSHRACVMHAYASMLTDSISISEADVCMPVVPLFHALGWGVPLASCFSGASLVLPGEHTDPAALSALIEASGTTMGAGIPTVWLRLVEAVASGSLSAEALGSLQRLWCGGAAVTEPLTRACQKLGIDVVAAWGMTETVPVATCAKPVTTVPASHRDSVARSLGRPLPGIRTRVVDDDERELEWNGRSIGELQVSGPWVADAYFDPGEPDNRGSLERFARDADGTPWLRTGDMAAIDSLGYARLVDRKKDLIKSGGEWISTVELENHLVAHGEVTEAAVIAIPDELWGERPLAIVAPAAGREDAVELERVLRDHLAGLVEGWQIPERILVMDALPRTGVGKIDKRRLRARFANE